MREWLYLLHNRAISGGDTKIAVMGSCGWTYYRNPVIMHRANRRIVDQIDRRIVDRVDQGLSTGYDGGYDVTRNQAKGHSAKSSTARQRFLQRWAASSFRFCVYRSSMIPMVRAVSQGDSEKVFV
ncbi:unnamed protein product [Prunus brigantina]